MNHGSQADTGTRADKGKPTGRGLRRLVYGLLLVFIVFAALLALLPTAARLASVYWLERQGLTASIDKIHIDYNDAVFEIINASGTNADGQGFRVGRLHLDLAWKPLWHKQLSIEDFEVSGLALDIQQSHQGLTSLAGLSMKATAPSQDKPQPATPSEPGWKIHLAQLHLQDINTCYQHLDTRQHLCIHLGQLDWKGPLQVDTGASAASPVSVQGELQMSRLRLEDRQHQQLVASLGKLELAGVAVKTTRDVSTSKIRLDDIRVFPESDKPESASLAGLQMLQLEQLAFNGDRLDIRDIQLDGIAASIRREKDASWQINHYLETLIPPSTADAKADKPEPVNPAPEQPLVVRIESLNIGESRDITFIDQSLTSPFRINARINDVNVSPLDTGDPRQESRIHLKLSTEKYGSLELAGEAQLMGKPPGFDLKGKVTGLDLRPISAYIQTALGYRVKSGQLNADIRLLAKQGQLDSNLSLVLQHFELKPGEPAKPGDKNGGTGLPLGAALSLLRDRDNSIHLDIPITGDVESPDFDPSDAIRKATSRAVTVAVVNYYTPFGLVTAVSGLYDLATALRFEPALYQAGTLTLTGKSATQLERLHTMLQDRPEINLSLCGYSNRDDMKILAPEQAKNMDNKEFQMPPALQQQLNNLAQQRSAKVKELLVKQGVPADRLVECEGEFDKDGITGVAISL